MKKDKIIYWISTALLCLIGAAPALMYYTNPIFVDGMRHLGFPDYFRYELATGKLIGLIIILIPQVPARLKEWGYAAFGIVYVSASIAHFNVDGPSKVVGPIIALSLLTVSYIYYHKVYDVKKALA